jgi:hypothetical protein
MTSLLAAKKPDWLNKKKDDSAKDDKAKCSVDNSKASVLDNVTTDTTGIVPAVGSDGATEESAKASMRKDLADLLSARLSGGKKNKITSKKGE